MGFGNAAQQFHVPALAELSHCYDVMAVVDPTEENRRIAIDLIGLSRTDVYADVDALWRRADLDVIDICTPPLIRRKVIEGATKLHLNILCEKPLARNPREAADLERMVVAGDGVFAMIHNYLYLPEYAALLSAIREGEVGQVEVVNINALGIGDIPGTQSYRPTWRHDPTVGGGGVLMDMMHYVYVAEALMGEPIERVTANAWGRGPTSKVEDLALCRFDSAVSSAVINVGWGPGPGGVVVSGTRGRGVIRYEDDDPFGSPEEVFVVNEAGHKRLEVGATTTGHREVFTDLARAISAIEQPSSTIHDGVRTLHAVMGAYESAWTGEPVELPLREDDPIYQRGVEGLRDLPLDRRSRLGGLSFGAED